MDKNKLQSQKYSSEAAEQLIWYALCISPEEEDYEQTWNKNVRVNTDNRIANQKGVEKDAFSKPSALLKAGKTVEEGRERSKSAEIAWGRIMISDVI